MGVPLSVNQGVINAVQSTLRVGLQLYWKFDGNHQDSVGSLHLTQVGTVTTSEAGKLGTAARFDDNSGNRLFRTDDPLLDLIGDFSISFWIKWNTLNGIVASKMATSTSGWALYDEFGHFQLTGTGGFSVVSFLRSCGPPPASGTPASITTGTWYHFVVRRTGTLWDMFMNGVNVHPSVSNASDFSNASTFGLGEYVNLNYPLNALVDEWAKWGRALTNAEITSLYNGGAGLAI